MNSKWKKLAGQAKKVVDQRGGTDQLKRDAEQLKGIAKGKGSLSDKAKAAAGALKEPGAPGQRSSGAAGGGASEEPVADQQAGAVRASERERRA